IKKFIPFLLLASFILMILTFIPGVGRVIQGSRRWIFLVGFSFQPSELVKLSLVLYLSHIFSKKEDRINDFVKTIMPLLVISAVFIILIYIQNDFSTAFFVFFLVLLMFFIARINVWYFLFLSSIGIPLAGILLFTKEHRVRRILTFINPDLDPVGSGYQVNAALSSLSTGGFWGVGIGEGTKKLGGLPEAHSDFIFAVLGEETGFIGVLFILSVFLAFAFRGYQIALKSENKFGYYCAFGITTTILYQTLLNIGVVGGLIPATGIPLPFFSSGGSSIVMALIMCGVLINVSRNCAAGEEAADD
ncbi:MAG: putative lipid II flippase FtsW, partial [Spirochaetales bacterium]